jgi:hypothetical protein
LLSGRGESWQRFAVPLCLRLAFSTTFVALTVSLGLAAEPEKTEKLEKLVVPSARGAGPSRSEKQTLAGPAD